MCCLDPQYLAVSIREEKYTHLGYRSRLSRLYTLDPHLALAFPRSSYSATPDPEQENNQGIPDMSQVPQADPLTTGLHNSNAYRVRHNELVAPLEPAPRVGQ
jgi:hypothetical protein